MMKRMNRRRVSLQKLGMTDLVVRNGLQKTAPARVLRWDAHDLSNSVRPDLSLARAMLHQAVTSTSINRCPEQKFGVEMDMAARLDDRVRGWSAQSCLYPYPRLVIFRPALITFALQALVT